MSDDRATYLDSSTLVKLVVREPGSLALRRYLRGRATVVSSAHARTEVTRALLPFGATVQRRGNVLLDRLELIRIGDRVLMAAGRLQPPKLHSLDAIHLATATLLGAALGRLVTYDERLAAAAIAQRISVFARAADHCRADCLAATLV